jgi:GAF domain-containing protein
VASDELRASWQRSERYLAEAVAQQDLASDARAMALDFIAHNQFGVAFEYLTSVLAETDAELTELVRRALARAASEMSLEDEPGLERLSAFRLAAAVTRQP